MSQRGELWGCHHWGVKEGETLGLPLLQFHRDRDLGLPQLQCHKEGNAGAVTAVVSQRGEGQDCHHCGVTERGMLALLLLWCDREGNIGAAIAVVS